MKSGGNNFNYFHENQLGFPPQRCEKKRDGENGRNREAEASREWGNGDGVSPSPSH